MFVANDWHTSLLPFYLQVGRRCACDCAQQHRFQCAQLALFITSHWNWPDLDSLAANVVLPRS